MKRFIFTLLAITASCLFNLFAQAISRTDSLNSTRNCVIELYDGTTVSGKIISRSATNVLIETNSKSTIDFSVDQIKRITVIVPEKTWPNQLPNRYFLNQSAYNLKQNEAYLKLSSCYSLNPILPFTFISSFNYGFTDYFSVETGMDLITLLNSKNPVFYINPKLGFEIIPNKLHLGGGLLYANMGNNTDSLRLGMGYATITWGNPEQNISLTGGYGKSWGKWVYRPTFTLSGLTKVSKRLYLVSENWIAPVRSKTLHSELNTDTFEEIKWYTYRYDYNLYISYAMRLITSRYAVDLGFINNKNIFNSSVIGSPFIDFVIKFE